MNNMNWQEVQEHWKLTIEEIENVPANERAYWEKVALEICRAAEAEIDRLEARNRILESMMKGGG